MKVFISGGCKNGKSTVAENIAVKLAAGRPLYYMATMIPHDEEDQIRIARHVEARKGKGFVTVECGESLCGGLKQVLSGKLQGPEDRDIFAESRGVLADGRGVFAEGVFLVDAVTALLSNRYDRPEEVLEDLKSFCGQVENAVFVSDFIYSAREGYSEFTEIYRKGLADCDRYLARVSDAVLEICAGQAVVYKGKELL